MEITTEELLAEAGRMALELRLKDREIVRLAAENAELKTRPGTPTEPTCDRDPT